MVFKSQKNLFFKFTALIVLCLFVGALFPDLAGAQSLTVLSDSSDLGRPINFQLDNAVHFLPGTHSAVLAQINLYPNIETIGVTVNGTSLPTTAELKYRQSNDPNWHTGHPLVRIDDGRLVGSLFGLSPSTSYEIKVSDGTNEISGTTVTQADELPFTPASIIYVSANASSTADGSSSAPYKTIQEGVNHASPGTQVLVADGIYHESVTFPASGGPNNWLQIKAQGSGAVLDGSYNPAGDAWEQYNDRKNIWFTKLGGPIKYLARDQSRFYNYDDLKGLLDGSGHNNIQVNEGWFIEPYTWKLYVRTAEKPSSHTWQIPEFSHAFKIENQDWIWIEGFEMRFYGVTESCGVCTINSSHIVVRKNKIHNLQLGVFTNWNGNESQGNDARIEYNEIYDPPVSEWPWAAVKATSMEGTGIVVRGHIGTIVRGNDIHNFFNGIYTGSSAANAIENPGVAFDADIYNNHIHNIGDDALEPEGANVNERFRNNTVDSTFVGISLAPITQGPTWVLRSTYSNFTSKSIKWDLNSDGIVLIYHNTSWTNAPNVNAADLISPIHNIVMRNNIFSSTGYGFQEVLTGSTGNNWDYDNWYTTHAAPHFKWENILYNTVKELCPATGLECKGYDDSPGLTNPGGGNFALLPTSPNVDRGVVIPGINDNYYGNAPDVGANELALAVDLPPKVISITRVDANPTSAASVNFTVTFSEPVSGVITSAPFNDFTLFTDSGIAGAAITNVTPVSSTTYAVTANSGTGNGTIRLDLIDGNSIVDSAGKALGGTGLGDGSFNTGESYILQRSVPFVTGIQRADLNPTSADVIHFNVTFSKEVSGVDVSDFVLTNPANIPGTGITNVNGAGSTYVVTVSIGMGNGTLRLDLLDNDSILDANNNPLGGVGAGNANFATGEEYTVTKIVPIVVSSVRADPTPTSADVIRFIVTFSEPVSGVDGGDFIFATTGDISGTSITVVGNGDPTNTYNIVLALGSGTGTLRLDLVDNDSIVDAQGQPLGGAGAGNGNFSAGESYTINKPVVVTVTDTFISSASYDGWVLESGENSNKGGSKNASATTFNIGDDAKNRQYKSILHFSTSALPDNAVITMVLLTLKKQGQVGIDPFTTHQNISIDIRNGVFGSFGPFSISALEESDFQYPASLNSVGVIQNNPYSGWYWVSLDPKAFQYINVGGSTQFRLGFQLDDNNDSGDDYVKFFSGNAENPSDRPQMAIQYSLPK